MTCRRREQVRRSYYKLPPLPYLKRGRPCRMSLPTDPIEIAYVAGLFDGEGCITSGNGHFRLQLAMTDQAVIYWLGRWGGTVRERSVVGNRKRCWRWLVMADEDVAATLAVLLPYLRVKRAQAEVALAALTSGRARPAD